MPLALAVSGRRTHSSCSECATGLQRFAEAFCSIALVEMMSHHPCGGPGCLQVAYAKGIAAGVLVCVPDTLTGRQILGILRCTMCQAVVWSMSHDDTPCLLFLLLHIFRTHSTRAVAWNGS